MLDNHVMFAFECGTDRWQNSSRHVFCPVR